MILWWKNPALLIAITVLIGISAPLWFLPWSWVFPILWTLYLGCIRCFVLILLIPISIVYSFILCPKNLEATRGYFSISSLQSHQSPFHRDLVYKGRLITLGQSIPCSIFHKKENSPRPNCDYIVEGKLIQKDPYSAYFKALRWIPIPNTWSLASFRYEMKERLRSYLDAHLQKRASSFIGSLLTADVEDRMIRYQFGKLGLQHILAVSGFHFAILVAFCTAAFRLFLSYRDTLIALLIAINLYFLFVGSLPAVQRAWLMCSFYFVGKLIMRHASSLNLMGAALLIEVILDPLICTSIGFQLSFASCLGIFLLLNPIRKWLSIRPVQMNSAIELHRYLILRFFKESMALTLAVNGAIWPFLFYHFHSFPLLSLFYNLFFPFLVSLSLFGTLLGMASDLIFAPLANLFFSLTNFLTNQILDLAAYPPAPLDYSLQVYDFPAWIIPFYLFALLLFTTPIFIDRNSDASIKSQRFSGDRSSVG